MQCYISSRLQVRCQTYFIIECFVLAYGLTKVLIKSDSTNVRFVAIFVWG